VLSPEAVKQVGAIKASFTTDVWLADGRKIPASVYLASIAIDGREGPAIVLAFEGAKEVVGVQTLESLGLKPNPDTGKLEATRPKGVAYFYPLY
jgi:predicted aspartyl protease